MTWNHTLLALVFSAAAMAATLPNSDRAQVFSDADERLSYECARNVAGMVERSQQQGPVFTHDELVFSSVETVDGNRLLIVSAGAGIYAVPLESRGVNRLRFELPTGRSTQPRLFFVSYLHDRHLRSRVFEASAVKAPVGKEDLDYRFVYPSRAGHLLPHLEYAIWETSSNALTALTDGLLRRDQIVVQKADCEHLQRRQPILVRNLRRNLDELELMGGGPAVFKPRTSARLPASVPH